MRIRDITEGVGRITKQNQTVDVGPDEVTKQAAKFGNKVDRDGRPPTLSKKVKGKSTNVLYNLGLAEGYKLQLERDKEMLVLHIKDTATGKRTEVRGKSGYESGNYDPNDSLHILLDKVGKSANISDLMNGEVVSINPNHPDATKAKAATDRAYSETYTRNQLPQIKNSQLKNIKHTLETVDIDSIIPVQQERIIENFKRQVDNIVAGKYKPIIVDSNNKIVNGHHRYTALQMLEYKEVQVARLPWTLEQILENFANDKNQVKEALDQPYPVRWTMKDDDEWEGKAKTEAGDSIQIMITQGHNNHKWEIDFYVGGSMQVTGKGDQFRIFATVVSAVKKWWSWLSKSKQPVEAIIFSAFKGNKSTTGSAGRSSLYNRFANQFARSIGFTVSTVDRADNVKFVLTNPNYKNQQTENFADGKKPGRKGLAKRSGVNTKASVSDLRKTAKNSSGEKQRMAHWLANMKSGRKK